MKTLSEMKFNSNSEHTVIINEGALDAYYIVISYQTKGLETGLYKIRIWQRGQLWISGDNKTAVQIEKQIRSLKS